MTRALMYLFLAAGLVSCKDLTGSPGLPSGTPNPTFYNTPAGAVGMRNAALFEVEVALPQYIVDAGLLTDELEDLSTGASPGVLVQNANAVSDPLDERILPDGSDGGSKSYMDLQNIRAYTNQAIGALATYDTAAANRDASKMLRGELYALEGYAEVMLADLFCSGVPLSTLDYQKDFTYAPSDSTTQVYRDAIAKFDSALTLASASDSIMHLAQVGQGRAYLDLGQYAAAADDVTTVPTGYQYQLTVVLGGNFGPGGTNFFNTYATMSDREGGHGLPYRSSGDPRTTDTVVATTDENGISLPTPLYFPTKYIAALTNSGYAPFTLASGTEARLIQAEAALQMGDATTWLTDLNALRTPASGLPQITDPGDPAARIDTLFTERAAWLFLTGHRQGDLRRLLRQYSRYPAFNSQQQVYPSGPYLGLGTGQYGTDVTAPVPSSEFANPMFHGCLDHQP